MQINETASGLCPMMGFCVGGVERSGSTASEFVTSDNIYTRRFFFLFESCVAQIKDVGFEGLTAVVMHVTPCTPSKINRRFGGKSPPSSGSNKPSKISA
jgi:hypothetical protein